MGKLFFIIRKILGLVVNRCRLFSFQHEWRRKNPHNETTAFNIFPLHLVSVGRFTYGEVHVYSWETENELLQIGDFCSIASGVKFILGGNHRMHFLSTFPFKYKFTKEKEAYSNGNIIIKDDVWIGSDVSVLSGVTLGQGCVVAAGSLVTKSFPEYSVIGGVPAKLLSRRFDEDKAELLKQINFAGLEQNKIVSHLRELYTDLSALSAEEVRKATEFMKQ